MKQMNQAPTVVYHNSEVEQLLPKEVAVIEQDIKTFANDLAQKNLPGVADRLETYIAKIRSPFQNLLEKIHKKIGALGITGEITSVEQNYEKEEQTLEAEIDKTRQELRLKEKEQKQLKGDLGPQMRHWNIALWFLVALTGSEILINFKIFLSISTNTATAFVGALGIGIAMFVVCHVYKDILNLFSTRITKIAIGTGIIGLIIALLYSFAKMRLEYNSNMDGVASEHVSEWNFVLLNLILVLSGIALTVIYKPSKKTVSDYKKHKKVAGQVTLLQNQLNGDQKRLAVLTEEKNSKMDKLNAIILMAHHYERIVASEYERVFALWCSEGMIARKNDEIPACYSELPKPLRTYFDHIHQNHNQL